MKDKRTKVVFPCKNGIVFVTIEATLSQEQEIVNRIIYTLREKGIDGIKDIKVNTIIYESGD